MLFNVAGLLRATVGATRSYDLGPESVQDDGERYEDIRGPVRMMRTDRGILVEAKVTAAGGDICSRCLKPVSTRIEVDIEEEFYPINPFPGAGIDYEHPENTGGLDDTVLLIDDRNQIDLTEPIRQALVAARPMAPVCRADCRGICPVCHRDRNADPCTGHESGMETGAMQQLAREWRSNR